MLMCTICRCKGKHIEKGRAADGRRAYRCGFCGTIWTNGLQGRKRKYAKQRSGYQFATSRTIS